MDWIKEFPAAITVCDKNGIIIEMNEKSAATFTDDGGYALIGKNLKIYLIVIQMLRKKRSSRLRTKRNQTFIQSKRTESKN